MHTRKRTYTLACAYMQKDTHQVTTTSPKRLLFKEAPSPVVCGSHSLPRMGERQLVYLCVCLGVCVQITASYTCTFVSCSVKFKKLGWNHRLPDTSVSLQTLSHTAHNPYWRTCRTTYAHLRRTSLNSLTIMLVCAHESIL
jgi:hypothetical protein